MAPKREARASLRVISDHPIILINLINKFTIKGVFVADFAPFVILLPFLKLLIGSETQLFCVGDDWQSIYGFRGSEVDYIINFKKYFNPAA
jgi:superfamily I DNA/RNA helicase